MTLSDALPVQFWLAEADTYNEKDPQGVFSKCFCHPWECGDQIKIQFSTTTGLTLRLYIQDSDDAYITDLAITEIANGIYDISFLPEDYGICDQEIQLFITNANDSTRGNEIVTNPGFEVGGALSPWESVAGPNINWAQQGGTDISLARAEASFSGGAQQTDVLGQDLTEQTAGYYYLTLRTILSTSGSVLATVNAYNNGVLVQEILSEAYNNTAATDFEYLIYITGTFDRIEIIANRNGSGTLLFGVSTGSLKRQTFSGELARTDCLSIKSTQKETVLITYSDNKNFASLNYSLVSPDPEFSIRVPAVFFHERFPEESEVIELSNSRSIQLNAQVKAQRKLELGSMPYYMHRKLKLILKHQFVTIDDQDWVQSETYEVIEGNRRYPLKKAAVWLDEKDYIMRNIL